MKVGKCLWTGLLSACFFVCIFSSTQAAGTDSGSNLSGKNPPMGTEPQPSEGNIPEGGEDGTITEEEERNPNPDTEPKKDDEAKAKKMEKALNRVCSFNLTPKAKGSYTVEPIGNGKFQIWQTRFYSRGSGEIEQVLMGRYNSNTSKLDFFNVERRNGMKNVTAQFKNTNEATAYLRTKREAISQRIAGNGSRIGKLIGGKLYIDE